MAPTASTWEPSRSIDAPRRQEFPCEVVWPLLWRANRRPAGRRGARPRYRARDRVQNDEPNFGRGRSMGAWLVSRGGFAPGWVMSSMDGKMPKPKGSERRLSERVL